MEIALRELRRISTALWPVPVPQRLDQVLAGGDILPVLPVHN
jgi:hypothetical protein